jgi:hypothetical protein
MATKKQERAEVAAELPAAKAAKQQVDQTASQAAVGQENKASNVQTPPAAAAAKAAAPASDTTEPASNSPSTVTVTKLDDVRKDGAVAAATATEAVASAPETADGGVLEAKDKEKAPEAEAKPAEAGSTEAKAGGEDKAADKEEVAAKKLEQAEPAGVAHVE